MQLIQVNWQRKPSFWVVMTQEILMSLATHRIRIIEVARPPTRTYQPKVGLTVCVIPGLVWHWRPRTISEAPSLSVSFNVQVLGPNFDCEVRGHPWSWVSNSAKPGFLTLETSQVEDTFSFNAGGILPPTQEVNSFLYHVNRLLEMAKFGSIWLKTGQFSPLLINSGRVGSGNL